MNISNWLSQCNCRQTCKTLSAATNFFKVSCLERLMIDRLILSIISLSQYGTIRYGTYCHFINSRMCKVTRYHQHNRCSWYEFSRDTYHNASYLIIVLSIQCIHHTCYALREWCSIIIHTLSLLQNRLDRRCSIAWICCCRIARIAADR